MSQLAQGFVERTREIDAYLNLLDALEDQVRTGAPRIGQFVITAEQQRILYSSVYLQLYNLVESTVSTAIDALCRAIAGGNWKPADLSLELRREWVRHLAGTHEDLNYENRLSRSLVMCDQLVNLLPVSSIRIRTGGGGNWDDESIYELAKRLGCALNISQEANAAAKRHVRDQKGTLALVVDLRNKLAHGEISFGQCGQGVTVNDLRELKERTARYLTEVVSAFSDFIDQLEFLTPQHPARRSA